jgi:hypothetical protein
MRGPEFIDNLDGNTLVAALARVLTGISVDGGLSEAASKPGRLDIASAFFSPSGFASIADSLKEVERIRLIIGAEPPRSPLGLRSPKLILRREIASVLRLPPRCPAPAGAYRTRSA